VTFNSFRKMAREAAKSQALFAEMSGVSSAIRARA
jgi:hypothetical protein